MQIKKILLILGLAGFTVMADNWVVSPILPSISSSIGVLPTTAGILITAYMIPFGLFQLVFGPLADRYGKKQVINFTMLFFTIATALCATGASLTGLALYRALTGVFAAAIMPVSLALIGDLVPMQQRQSAIGTFMGISFLGQGLSMAIGGITAYFVSWRGVFAIYALLAVVSTLLLFTAGKNIPSSKNPQSRLLAPYAKLLSSASSALTYLVVLLEGIFIIGSFSYLGVYIEHNFHFNNLYIGLIMTAFGLLAVIGGRLSGKLAARLGRKKVLLLGLFAAALADIIFTLYGTNLAILITGVGLLGLGFMLAHSTLLTIATEFDPMARGSIMSLVAFCFMGGGGVGTALGGRLIAAHSYTWFFSVYGLGIAVLIVLAAAVVPATITAKQPGPLPGPISK